MTVPEGLPQIALLRDVIKTHVGPDLIGIYLHGSLAMGSFQPARSDIDVLVIMHELLSLPTKRQLIENLLVLSKAPHPIEISFMAWSQIHPWRYPCPYDLHFSEDHRERLARALRDGTCLQWSDEDQRDPDLAAHFMVARARGSALDGPPITDVLPPVPAADYRTALRSDLAAYNRQIFTNPVYCILNCCRMLAYQHDGVILSKAEGGDYALEHLPSRYYATINSALSLYKTGSVDTGLDSRSCQAFLTYALSQLSL